MVDNFLCGGFFFCVVDDQAGGAAGQILEKKNKVATNQRRYEFDEFARKKLNKCNHKTQHKGSVTN